MSAPEIRIDQLTGLRTILAPGRADRPEAFAKAARDLTPRAKEGCPFCEGHEERTPPETWAFRPSGGEPDTPGWVARSMPNLYPVLGEQPATIEDGGEPAPEPVAGAPEPSLDTGLAASIDPLRASTRGTAPDLFAHAAAEGAHEVLVNAPEHVVSMAELSEERFGTAVSFWRERMRALASTSSTADPPRGSPAAYLHLIVNEAPEAGASREHTHAQLYATRFVPVEVARERERLKAYYERTMGGNLLEDVITEEVRRRVRVVAVDDEAILLCPWASRSPFEMRVIPRRPAPRFEQDEGTGTAMIRRAIEALARLFGPPPFNLWVRTAPHDSERFHWHVDIVPRLTVLAGFELGTGVPINVYPPERAASDLRETLG